MTETKKAEVAQPATLATRIEAFKAEREALLAFIRDTFVEGVDFGKIQIKNRDSKNMMFKAGSEKLVRMAGVVPFFYPDQETWAFAGSKPGTFCYLCHLLSADGEVMAEGRGTATEAEKTNVNNAVKMAEKRAQTDAVLRLFGLSDAFGEEDFKQDYERGHEDGPPAKPVHVPGATNGNGHGRAQQPEPTGKDPARTSARQALSAAMKKMDVSPEELSEIKERVFPGVETLSIEDYRSLTDLILADIPF